MSDEEHQTSFTNSLSEKIQNTIAPFLQDSKAEIADHIQNLIKTALQQHGLVTREMFDVQSALLTKTRLKLEALEAKINHLETLEPKL